LVAKSLHQHHSYTKHPWKAQEIDGVAGSAREGMQGIQRETTWTPVCHSIRRPQQEKSTWSKGTFEFTLPLLHTLPTCGRYPWSEWISSTNACHLLHHQLRRLLENSGIWYLATSGVTGAREDWPPYPQQSRYRELGYRS
jgi:hypothetical protein